MLGYDFYEMGYLSGYLSLDDLKWAVANKDLSEAQFKEITGQDYTA